MNEKELERKQLLVQLLNAVKQVAVLDFFLDK